MPDKNNQHDSSITDPQSRKVRYGAPDGPSKDRRESHEPLEYPGHEAVAQFLAAPRALREFKSDNDLAKHFGVTRMTIYRWKQNPDVIKRAYWLSSYYRVAGDIQVLHKWPLIAQKAIEKAMKGDMQAIKFCYEIACREDRQHEESPLSSMSAEEILLKYGEHPIVLPTGAEEELACYLQGQKKN